MENQPVPEKKRSFVWAVIVMSIFMNIVLGYILFVNIEQTQEINTKLNVEQNLRTTCSYTRDSLVQEVQFLSIYKTLTTSMIERDEAKKFLKYKIGDIVYVKSDSARVAISDIVIGGSSYEYYIHYKVMYKDNSTREIIPELIY